jgi:hypothetical protein
MFDDEPRKPLVRGRLRTVNKSSGRNPESRVCEIHLTTPKRFGIIKYAVKRRGDAKIV